MVRIRSKDEESLRRILETQARRRERTAHITCQGRLLTVHVPLPTMPPIRGDRSEIHVFSRASRLRQMKMFASLKPAESSRCTFLTFTLPTNIYPESSRQFSQWRASMWRALEAVWGETGGVWRIEWQPRKSGPATGQLYPHWHCIAFACKWIAQEYVRRKWAAIVGHKGNIIVDLREITNIRMLGHYVSKYMSKADDCYLDVPTYRSGSLGRQWGMFRKARLPWAPIEHFQVVIGAATEMVRNTAQAIWGGVPDEAEASYTLMAPEVARIAEFLRSLGGG